MNQSFASDIHKIQTSFARKAQAEPEHKFQDLWHILCREDWIRTALTKTLTNSGAKTAGMDGVSKSSLKDEGRQTVFIENLKAELKSGSYKPTPVRRVWIPKPGKNEKRPLGIPTIKDRVVQEMLRMLMEPIWESDFLDCSNGFRPRRRTMDCILTLYDRIQRQNKYYWVIEGDIRKCFDRIHHEKLMELVQKRIKDRKVTKLINAFLSAGVMENGLFQETTEGTPQGGILSPLLANIYLHELDKWWWTKYGNLDPYEKKKRRMSRKGNFILTRYADDFIILCNGDLESAKTMRQEVKDFLWTELNLELSEEKTHITHANDGFDFLGFHIQRKTPKDNKPWLFITATSQSEQRLRDKIKKMTGRAMSWEPVPEKIRAMNRVLRGWGNYYNSVSSIQTRQKLDWYVHQRMLKWLTSRHKGLGKRAVLKMYYIRQGNRHNWGCKDGESSVYIFMLRDISKVSYRPKKLGNPYLMDNEVPQVEAETPHINTWDGTTNRHQAAWREIRMTVLERDGYMCQQCGATENLEAHHLKPSGGMVMENLQTLCRKCHQQTESYGRKRKQMQSGKKTQ